MRCLSQTCDLLTLSYPVSCFAELFPSLSSHLSYWQVKKLNQAIEDCTSAIRLDETYIKAYLRRAQWYGIQTVWVYFA